MVTNPLLYGLYMLHIALAALLLPAAAVQDSARVAAEKRIAANLSEKQIDRALEAYDAYIAATKSPDLGLLQPIARAELERAAQTAGGDLAADALERLARSDDQARRTLQSAAAEPGGADPIAALLRPARLGDRDAQARLAAMLKTAAPEAKVQIAQALAAAGATAQAAAVAALLDDALPHVRGAAAVAVGSLGYSAAIPKLRALAANDLPTVKMMANLGLARLGDTSGATAAEALLRSEVPEVRLLAGQALQGSKNPQWTAAVKELRADRNPSNAIRAADVVACCDPVWAKGILVEALGNSMAIVRLEAARVLEERDLADARLVRQMLGDNSQSIRIHGAGAAIRLAAAAAAKRRGH